MHGRNADADHHRSKSFHAIRTRYVAEELKSGRHGNTRDGARDAGDFSFIQIECLLRLRLPSFDPAASCAVRKVRRQVYEYFNCRIVFDHIASEENVVPDRLSRGESGEAMEALRQKGGRICGAWHSRRVGVFGATGLRGC